MKYRRNVSEKQVSGVQWPCSMVFSTPLRGRERYTSAVLKDDGSDTRSTGSSVGSWASPELPDSKFIKPAAINVGITGIKIYDKSTSKVYVDKPSYFSELSEVSASEAITSEPKREKMKTFKRSLISSLHSRVTQETDKEPETLQVTDFPILTYDQTVNEVSALPLMLYCLRCVSNFPIVLHYSDPEYVV